MIGQALAYVVIRAVALWIFLNGVLGLSLVFQQWLEQDFARQTQVAILIANTLLPMATSLVVWANADWLSRHVVGASGDSPIGWDLQGLTRLSIAVVGLVTLVHVIPTLAWQTSVAIQLTWWRNSLLGPMSAPADLRAQYWDVSGKANIVSEVVSALLGLALVAAPGRVAALIGFGERTGRPPNELESDGAAQQGVEADEAR
jgi:hypothetical protein